MTGSTPVSKHTVYCYGVNVGRFEGRDMSISPDALARLSLVVERARWLWSLESPYSDERDAADRLLGEAFALLRLSDWEWLGLEPPEGSIYDERRP